jgi:RimJ/RimL family protein N-acetyltransferase
MTQSVNTSDMDVYFIPPERFETEYFVIRSYLPGDSLLCAEALNTSYDHIVAFLEWARPHTSINQAEKTARVFRAHYLLNQDYALAVLNTDETRWIGSSGYHLREGGMENRSAEIGMWIRKDVSGQGLGTRLLCDLLTWGFTTWPWERLSWRCNQRNIASRRTAEKAGMVLEGRLREKSRQSDGTRDDMFYFSALRSEWQDPRVK